jgi:hypothetical protein
MEREFELFTPSGGQWHIAGEREPQQTPIFLQQSTVTSQTQWVTGPTFQIDLGNVLRRIKSLEDDNEGIKSMLHQLSESDKVNAGFIKINLLPSKNLSVPLDAVVEPDDNGFIARTTDIPIYGYGDDPIEAVDALRCEIESLYNDLMEDDEFTEEWLKVKEFLSERIIER